MSPLTVISSTLLESHVCVDYFTNWFYLLDGRFDQLRTFPVGGLVKYVYQVSLYDKCPFQYEFFLRIVLSFSFIKELTVINKNSQKNKSESDNQDVLIIKYPRLTKLNLIKAHDD
ncbi:unnamed protein product [Rotaria sp. Silwood1]|nr:unnamed protein product [Rotaria sp. Silwood1]